MGQLILIPVPLHESDGLYQHPLIRNTIKQARNVIVESLKMGKRHLNRLGHSDTQAVDWHLLNEHTNAMDRIQWIHSIAQDEYPWFLMSDAGCPAIADPGTELILQAHFNNIHIRIIGVESAITRSIMSSGLSGQRFSFEGYLPIEPRKRIQKLKELEHASELEQKAFFFIETPYRNANLFNDLLQVLKPQTCLYIGFNFGADNELLKTRTVSDWKKTHFQFPEKAPCTFGIAALALKDL